MKALKRLSLVLACMVALATPSFSVQTQPVEAKYTTKATGYTKASDVEYNESGTYIANWGARGEDCTFLTTYATSFYTGSYTYEMLSMKSGGTAQNNAHNSALYSTLQTLMKSKHKKETGYQETRQMYRYTDCLLGDSSEISSFYSGKELKGAWDSGATWNREHTWPNSKGLGGNDENDIIMLRPTWVDENSSRGNTAYGQSSGYYDPNSAGTEVRGDCARIFLYVYVRWGNTSRAWGSSGVMESMSVLLKWMEEDPVDTWEMGRNDVVEDITGTRNVFVDYPELAWKLFSKEIPDDMPTPSGKAMNNGSSQDSSSSNLPNSSSSSEDSSYEEISSENSSYQESSEEFSSEESVLPEYSSEAESPEAESSEEESIYEGCQHEYGDWFMLKEPTETEYGERIKTCIRCGDEIREKLPKTSGGNVNCQHEYGDWYVLKEPTMTAEGKRIQTCIRCGDTITEILPIIGDETKESIMDSAEENCSSSIGCASAVITILGAYTLVIKKREE